MLQRILKTDGRAAALVVRVALGLVMLPHGAQKLLGWFGGYGLSATLGYFDQQLGIPAALGLLVVIAESFGALGLILGLLSRVAAFGIAVVMGVAAFAVHLGNGFFMNWSGQAAGEGFEYHVLALGLAIGVMIEGSGKWSLDRVLARRLGRGGGAGRGAWRAA